MASEPDPAFYAHVVHQLTRGRLTPFLGAGVNLVGIGDLEPFVSGTRLPSGSELAEDMAREFDYPGDSSDLVRVAQWVSLRLGSLTLYEYLHTVFDHDFTPGVMHDVLAQMPGYVRRSGGTEFPLIITTNYDDALEKAFEAADEEFDLLTYIATGEQQGKFHHERASGESTVIEVPNRYKGVTLRERPAIAKIHGAVHRGASDPDEDSYVVTEDDYIDCLTRTDIVSFLPPGVVQRMQRCHYLFLGYSLRDWNLRAILHRIRRDRALANESWVLQPVADSLEERAWKNRNVEMFETDLATFAKLLDERLQAAPDRPEVLAT